MKISPSSVTQGPSAEPHSKYLVLVLVLEDLPSAPDVEPEPSFEALAYPACDALRARHPVSRDGDGDPARVRHDADPDGARAGLGRERGPLRDLRVAPCDAFRGAWDARGMGISVVLVFVR